MIGGPAATGPVAILAGSGDLPVLLADSLAARGREHRILAFRGFASRAVRKRADATVGLLDVRGALGWLRRWAPGCVTLAGGLRRPNAGAFIDALSTLRSRGEIADVLARGDDNLLRAALGLLEEHGFGVLGIHDLAPELLAPPGVYGAVRPTDAELASVAVGLSALGCLSSFDIGQAIVVSGRRVLALEGPEGTDRMLARAGALASRRLFRRPDRGGVLVKAPKHGQDLRVDLPAVGPRTVVNAARAGLAGIAVASGYTIVLERGATVAAADRLGLFLVGVDPEGRQPGAEAELP
ncbi:MAG: LpxI family protein [Enterovirga sp.]|nr:LpxI family protein [Enterovirga sp.]